MRDEALRWLSEAEWDLATTRGLHQNKRYNAACFYAQQSAEKAAKALLYFRNESPWGHSVRELLDRYAKNTQENIMPIISGAKELDRHYIPSRYPDSLPAGTPHEAYDETASKRAIRHAGRLSYMQK
jgi:HEPN domain-containing protein